MLSLSVPRKPAPLLAMRGAWGRTCVRPKAFGNALGDSIVANSQSSSVSGGSGLKVNGSTAASWGPQYSLDEGSALPTSYALSGNGARLGGSGYESQPTPGELQAAFRQSERDYRSATEQSVAGSGYVARSGDSISRIVGSSDPQAIGNFMRANGLTSSNIEVGRNYFRPDDVAAYGNGTALGQAVLNNDNARLAALAQERFAFSDGLDARDIRQSFVYRSRMSVELSKFDAQAAYEAQLASLPKQYIGPIDDAAMARTAMEQQRTANNLAAALGGPFVATPMLGARAAGLNEFQVEQAGMLGLAALDAAGVKSGSSAIRLGSGVRGLGPLTPQRLDPYFAGDSWTPVRAWRLVEEGGRYFTVGANGSKFSAMGEYNFITVNGETFVAKQQVGGHYDISMGAGSVDYAGTARFGKQDGARGFVKEWSNNSGHYTPDPNLAGQAGLPLDLFKPHR